MTTPTTSYQVFETANVPIKAWTRGVPFEGVTCTPIARSATRTRGAWRETLVHEPGGCDGRPHNLVIVRLRQ